MRWTVSSMKIRILLALLILTTCVDRTTDHIIADLTLHEIEERINGAWKLKTLKTKDRTTEFDLRSDTLMYIEFNGLKGTEGMLIDNHDGTYGTRSDEPICELMERDGKKIIKYSLIFNDSWEKEIKSLSRNELALADSARTWTYVRQQLKSVE
jgi:hypothetical protein